MLVGRFPFWHKSKGPAEERTAALIFPKLLRAILNADYHIPAHVCKAA